MKSKLLINSSFTYLVFFVVLVFTSCKNQNNSPQPNTTTLSGVSMEVPYKIIIGKALSQEQVKEINNTLLLSFEEINTVYNNWNPDSEISKINKLPANTPQKISKKLALFLKRTDFYVSISNGMFDPTVAPLLTLWKHYLNKQQKPPQEKIDHLLPAIGWDNLFIKEQTIIKKQTKTEVDLCGFVKGYCVDLILERLVEKGYPNLYVEWGGDIRTQGEHPDNRPWAVYISKLGDSSPENAVEKVSLNNVAIATSGDYYQNWTVVDDSHYSEKNDLPNAPASTTYYHIMNPKKGEPFTSGKNKIASVTIMTKTCELADALATTAMMFDSKEEAQKWLEETQKLIPETSFWIISR